MATSEEIAWAAGLFEGEGSICFTGKNSAKLSIEMTDPDVLEKFQRVVGGVGNITDKTRRNPEPQWKDRWSWQLYRGEHVERILRDFLPWFCERRGQKARDALERLSQNHGPRAERTHCIRGHELTDENTYRWAEGKAWKPNWRRCKQCHREAANRRYHERKVVGLA